MRVRIVEDANAAETEIILSCRQINEEVRRIEAAIHSAMEQQRTIGLFQNGTQYNLLLSEILFFETAQARVQAHTGSDMFDTDLKLYQLEEVLPGYFLRISKSAIVNVRSVYAVTRNLTASSVVEFQGTHKQVYVSRHYYKLLRERMEEERIRYE